MQRDVRPRDETGGRRIAIGHDRFEPRRGELARLPLQLSVASPPRTGGRGAGRAEHALERPAWRDAPQAVGRAGHRRRVRAVPLVAPRSHQSPHPAGATDVATHASDEERRGSGRTGGRLMQRHHASRTGQPRMYGPHAAVEP